MFLLDEAWLFIRNETIRNYIVQAQKTWRKHQRRHDSRHAVDQGTAGIGHVADRLRELPDQDLPRQPGDGPRGVREAFHLNDTELDLIAGLVPPGQMLIRKAQSSARRCI